MRSRLSVFVPQTISCNQRCRKERFQELLAPCCVEQTDTQERTSSPEQDLPYQRKVNSRGRDRLHDQDINGGAICFQVLARPDSRFRNAAHLARLLQEMQPCSRGGHHPKIWNRIRYVIAQRHPSRYYIQPILRLLLQMSQWRCLTRDTHPQPRQRRKPIELTQHRLPLPRQDVET